MTSTQAFQIAAFLSLLYAVLMGVIHCAIGSNQGPESKYITVGEVIGGLTLAWVFFMMSLLTH